MTKKDLLDEMIEARTAANPEFPKLLAEAEVRRGVAKGQADVRAGRVTEHEELFDGLERELEAAPRFCGCAQMVREGYAEDHGPECMVRDLEAALTEAALQVDQLLDRDIASFRKEQHYRQVIAAALAVKCKHTRGAALCTSCATLVRDLLRQAQP